MPRYCCTVLFYAVIVDNLSKNIKKLKQSRNRPGVAQRVPEGLAFQIS